MDVAYNWISILGLFQNLVDENISMWKYILHILEAEFPFVKTLSYQDTKCIFGIEKKMEEIRNVTAICVKTKLKRIETRIEKKKKTK